MFSDYLIEALKRGLKENRVSYRQAGKALGLSESSIKRLFSEKSFSLSRLEALCELANTDLAGLMQRAEQLMQKTDSLSVAQEQEIVNDPRLLLVAVCVINHCEFCEILEKYDFSEAALVQLFIRLDRLGIIEFQPGNRYRLMISKRFSWQHNGPIMKLFTRTIASNLLTDEIAESGNHLHYVWGMMTPRSAKAFAGKIQRLLEEFLQESSNDTPLPMKDKLTSSLLVLFREDWEPRAFRKQQRVDRSPA
jgi:transcriptional regulator with XRE-family HTH domain